MRVHCLFFPLSAFIVAGSASAVVGCSSKGGNGSPGGDSGPTNESDSTTGESEGGCTPFSESTQTFPTISFKQDVLPIFQFSCGISTSCHGGDPSMDIMARGVFLGCTAAQLDAGTCTAMTDEATEVYNGLVGSSANVPIEESCMPFVKQGDPTMSYLMHKLDGDQCTLSCCVAKNSAVATVEGTQGTVMGSGWCGDQMPYSSSPLPLGPACGGGNTACTTNPSMYTRDTIRAWIAQGAMNN
jgi:hypothetical protein